MKITILGAGALRLLGVVDEILLRPLVFRSPHLVFMDLDLEKAHVMAALAQRMPSAGAVLPTTQATSDLNEALEGADFVYCCIRVGGVKALERDKQIAAEYGYHGHDDFGPSGLMLTARTVPVLLDIAFRMEKLCPQAWLMIFTNPITQLVDAVARYSKIRSVGLCPGVYNFAWDMDHLFGIGAPCKDLLFRGGGLNHLSWVTADSTYKGENLMGFIRRQFDDLPHRPGVAKCGWTRCAPLVDLFGAMFLNNGHQHHFFYHDELAREMKEYFQKTIAEDLRSTVQDSHSTQASVMVRQKEIRRFWQQELFRNYAVRPFGEIGVDFMQAVTNNSGTQLMVTSPNYGHILGLSEGVPVEATTRIWNNRLEGMGLDPVPASLKGLCNAVAEHQRLSVDAVAVHTRKNGLFQALLAEPTIRSYERAKPMFDMLWDAAIESKEIPHP